MYMNQKPLIICQHATDCVEVMAQVYLQVVFNVNSCFVSTVFVFVRMSSKNILFFFFSQASKSYWIPCSLFIKEQESVWMKE